MAGNHHHHHSATGNLKLAFFLNITFTIIEIIGGLYVNSIAVLSDAIHDLGDSTSLGVAWYLQEKSKQESDSSFSFGYKRFSLLGALINSLILIVGSGFIIYHAVLRIIHPEMTEATGMLWLAMLGIAVNGFAAWRMREGRSLNERVVHWHLLEDVLGWLAILIAAIILHFYPSPYIDPILSLAITLYILYGVIKRLRETMFVFLQGTPAEIDMSALEKEICQIPNVHSVHHMHIWSLEGEHHVFTAHVKLERIAHFDEIIRTKASIKSILSNYQFDHYTVETELDEESCLLCQEEGL